MKKLLLPCFLLLSCACAAQGYLSEKVTYYDENGNTVKKKVAAMLRQTIQLNDTLWETNLYIIDRPRIISFQSSTADGQLLNGRYLTYDELGSIDTSGQYSGGKRSGTWSIYTKNLRLSRYIGQQHYSNGELVWQKDTAQLKHEQDSIKARLPKPDSTAAFGTFTKVEIESEFPGGIKAWQTYLNRSLRYPSDAYEKGVAGRVIVGFVVNEKGDVPLTLIQLWHSVSYSLDKESVRVICESGQWKSAVQNGRLVKSYKKQPIDFNLTPVRR